MARLSGACTGHKWPALPPNSKQASPRLFTTLPHTMSRVMAYAMRHRPFLAHLAFVNEKAWGTERKPRAHGDTNRQTRKSDTGTKRQRQTDKQRQKHVYAGKFLCYSLIFFGLNKTDRILDNH